MTITTPTLIGAAFLEKVKAMGSDVSGADLLHACGYVNEDGTEPRNHEFHNALLAAKAEEMGMEPQPEVEPEGVVQSCVEQEQATVRYQEDWRVMA